MRQRVTYRGPDGSLSFSGEMVPVFLTEGRSILTHRAKTPKFAHRDEVLQLADKKVWHVCNSFCSGELDVAKRNHGPIKTDSIYRIVVRVLMLQWVIIYQNTPTNHAGIKAKLPHRPLVVMSRVPKRHEQSAAVTTKADMEKQPSKEIRWG